MGRMCGIASITRDYVKALEGTKTQLLDTRKTTPGLRLEARFYPLTFEQVRPFLAAGTTVFSTGIGVRGAAGASVRFGRLQLCVDAAYERYLTDFLVGYSANAVLVGLGAGWQL